MTKFKKMMTLGVVCAVSTVGVTAFAATTYGTPAEVLAQLTGKSVESVLEEKHETGKSYGTLAIESGQLEAFKELNLQNKKAQLDEQVSEGIKTKEEAEAILKTIEIKQANCDGTGLGQYERENCMEPEKAGTGCGMNKGMRKGQGMGRQKNGGMRLCGSACN